MDMNGKWGVSQDEENYRGSFATKQEAIDEGTAIFDGEEFFVAEGAEVEIQVSGRNIIDQACEDASEAAGDHAESWLSEVSKEQEAELTETLTSAFTLWTQRHGFKKNFYTVKPETVECHQPPAEAAAPVTQ